MRMLNAMVYLESLVFYNLFPRMSHTEKHQSITHSPPSPPQSGTETAYRDNK
jgi:hypothetical protein